VKNFKCFLTLELNFNDIFDLCFNQEYDTISWTDEGPGIVSIVFYTLGQLSTDCEIIKLPPYTPSDEERADTRLFADNVAKVMCDELGVLQSFYSYDDVMFMGFAYVIIKLSLILNRS
jgi:hypothetical protein